MELVLDPNLSGQGPVSQDRIEAMEIFEQLVRQSQLQAQTGGDSSLAATLNGESVVGDGLDIEDGTKGKKRKDPELKICMALGCDKTIKRRRLCSTHQKQKERNNGKLELKDDYKDQRFTKGRSPTPFSKHANKYAKLKVFDSKIDQWAGGKEEGSLMLQAYIESSYYQARYPKSEDNKIYEQIGRNIVNFLQQLPEKSPLRKPLIKAMSEGIAPSRLTNILPISKRTIMYSKKLPDDDNLLLTIRYKPNVTRKRASAAHTGEEQQAIDAETLQPPPDQHGGPNEEEFVNGLANLGQQSHNYSVEQQLSGNMNPSLPNMESEVNPDDSNIHHLPVAHFAPHHG